MTGPWMGRVLGVTAAAAIVVLVVYQLVVRPFAPVLVGLAIAEAVLVVRLLLLLLVVGPPSDPVGSGVGSGAAMLVEARSSIAVICTDETLPAVRVAVSAAVAASSQLRVLLVGDHPGLADIAAEQGVRVVRSDGSWWGGVQAALAAATTDHLVLSSASTALLPVGIRRLASRWDDGCVFVQSDPVAPERRTALDHLRHVVLRPAADRRDATSWDGPGSMVTVEAFRALPITRGALANSVLLQRAGLHGRWCDAVVAVQHTPSSDVVDRSRSGALSRGLRRPQRLVQLHRSSDALGPAALLVAAAAVAAALVVGDVPVSSGPWLALLAAAHVAAAAARLIVTRGILRPGSLALDDARRLGARVLVVVAIGLDAALIARSVAMLGPDPVSLTRRDDLLLLGMGGAVLAVVLAGLGVLVWQRRLRPPEADPPPITAVVGDHTLPVSGITASVVDVVFDQPVALLGVVKMMLATEGRRSVMVRAQVVRVVRREARFVVSFRLVGTDAFGQHDDYVALWLASSTSTEMLPVRRTEASAGRVPVASGGNSVVRLGSALVLGCVALAALPITSASTTTTPPTTTAAASTTTPPTTTAAPTSTTPPTTTAAPTSTVSAGTVAAATTTTLVVDGPATPTLTVSARTGDGSANGGATPGQVFTWVVEVRNVSASSASTAVARGIDISLELPPNWIYSATSGISPTRCDSAPVVAPVDAVQTITWTDMCTLDPGQVITLSVSAVPQTASTETPGAVAGDGTPIAHVATVTLSAEDSSGTTLGTATADASATLRAADLSIRLTDGGDDDASAADGHRFVVGSMARLRAEVRNEGPDIDAGPITATVVVPSGLLTTGATGPGWTCAVSLAVVCTHPGPIAVGDALPAITVSAMPTPAAPELVTATATVASDALDPVPANDTDDEATPVRQESDLSITSVLSLMTPFAPGARIDVLADVVNNGPSAAAADLVVDDPLPAGVRLVAARGTGWYCGASRIGRGYTVEPDTNGALNCRRVGRSTAPGALDPIVVTLQVDPLAAAGAVPPSIGMVAHPTDRVAANNRSDGASTPAPAGGLSVQAFDGDRSTTAGDTAAGYDVVVGNQSILGEDGPLVVDGAATDSFTPTAVTGEGWECEIAGPAWTCTWGGTLLEPARVAPGATLPGITVAGSVAATASGVLRHTVTVRGAGTAAPVTTGAATPVAPRAELSITATAADAPWPVAGTGRSSIVVANAGPNGERGPVTVTAELDPGVVVSGVGGEGWDCRTSGGGSGSATSVSCTTRGAAKADGVIVAPGDTLPPISLEIDVTGDAPIRQALTVQGTTDTARRPAVATADVAARTDLSIAAGDQLWRPEVGATATAAWVVANAGPTTAEGVTVAVAMPAGISIAGASAGWQCDDRTPTNCAFASSIETGDTVPFELDLAVTAEARSETATAEVNATVRSDGADPDPTDDSAVRRAVVGEGSMPAPAATVTTVAPSVSPSPARSAGDAALRVLGGAVSAAAFAMAGVLAFGARRRRSVGLPVA